MDQLHLLVFLDKDTQHIKPNNELEDSPHHYKMPAKFVTPSMKHLDTQEVNWCECCFSTLLDIFLSCLFQC